MPNWTDNAAAYFAKALDWIRSNHSEDEDESREFAEDIKNHVETEITARQLALVSKDEIQKLLNEILGYEIDFSEKQSPKSKEPDARGKRTARERFQERTSKGGRFKRSLIVTCGIILPIVTFVFEILTRACTDTFFDPIPTFWHGLLIALVPVIVFWNYRFLKSATPPSALQIKLLGFIAAVAVFYSIPFAILTPFALIGIIYFGIGLLPLAPSLSLLAALLLAQRLLKNHPKSHCSWKTVGIGFLLGILAIGLVESPRVLTNYALSKAASKETTESLSGIRMLRTVGSEKQMLEACLPDFNRDSPFEIFKSSVGPSQARTIYYRVTGRPYQEALREHDLAPSFRLGNNRRSRWDPNVGDQVVGQFNPELHLQDTRIDGKVDANAAQGYVEWTFEFVNESYRQAEARAILDLPAGGVVSRATLWIDGEEREAAFSSRRKTVAAYKKVVSRRRDPLLVTSKGADKVMFQCFPIPRNGGTMKIRLGITFPSICKTQVAESFPCQKLPPPIFKYTPPKAFPYG